MSIIDEIAAKLKTAKRAVTKAQRAYDEAAVEAGERRKDLDRCQSRVAELEGALSILRNNLRPAAPPTGTVTQLIRK